MTLRTRLNLRPTLTALVAAGLAAWPLAGHAVYMELVPGTVTASSSYDDIRLLITGLVRLSMAFLALFAIIKGIQGYFEAHHIHGGSQSAMDNGWTTMQDSVKFVLMAIVLSAAAPYAVNLMFDLASGRPLSFF